MERTKIRTAHTATAVGDSNTCPECGREFCIIWIFDVLNMGVRFSEWGGLGYQLVITPHSRNPNAYSKDNQAAKKQFSLACAPLRKGIFTFPEA